MNDLQSQVSELIKSQMDDLSESRRIVEGHNGKIWFESEVGIGSTFYFSLPIDEHGIQG